MQSEDADGICSFFDNLILSKEYAYIIFSELYVINLSNSTSLASCNLWPLIVGFIHYITLYNSSEFMMI